MSKMKKWMQAGILTIGLTMISCQGFVDAVLGTEDNPAPTTPVAKEVTLEDALNDGTIVVLTFNLNGEDFYVAFMRVGDTYELLDFDKAQTRGDEPTITEKDCDFKMVHDKANNVINFTVTEKKTSDLVLTAIIDINASTMEVIPGDPKYKVTGVKMKVSNVEITNLLKEKGEGVTLTDALVKGAQVVIVYKWNNSNTTTFTFTNNGGTFSCNITGDNAQDFNSFLKIDGNELFFSATDKDWFVTDCNLEIKFNYVKNTFKLWTVTHAVYDSFTISVNGTDITSTLTKESV
jgi:hypothetical protein